MKKQGTRYLLSFEEAAYILPDNRYVNTILDNPLTSISVMKTKEEMLYILANADVIRLCREQAREFGYGICCYNITHKDRVNMMYIATDEQKLSELEKGTIVVE